MKKKVKRKELLGVLSSKGPTAAAGPRDSRADYAAGIQKCGSRPSLVFFR